MQAIIKAFRSAANLAVQQVKDSSISIAGKDEEEKRDMLQKCASTTLNSKLVSLLKHHCTAMPCYRTCIA